MSRFIVLAVSGVLMSVAPAMADTVQLVDPANSVSYAPAPTSTVVSTAQGTVTGSPSVAAPAQYATVPFKSGGLGGSGLAAGAVGAAALAAFVALVATNDDDDDAAVSTPGT